MAIYELIRRVDRRAEHIAEAVEGAFAAAPSSSMVSGGAASLVSWDSLSREGRRNVSTVLTARLIERVMGEPAAAEPIRVYVGLESAPTEYERRDLVLRELHRTGAFDRELLMVISPTGTGYVNYVAVEAAEYMTRGSRGQRLPARALRARRWRTPRPRRGNPPRAGRQGRHADHPGRGGAAHDAGPAVRARQAVEVGTFTGYSSICIARGLPDDGQLLCCNVSEEYTSLVRRYWDRAGVSAKIELRITPAVETPECLAGRAVP